jgi:hypothetical protein
VGTLTLVGDRGATRTVPLAEPPALTPPAAPLRSRVVYAAAHVVPVAWGDNAPGNPAQIDWDATLGFRRHLYRWGLGVADAMDTAQRGMGLDAAATRELVRRSAAVALEEGGSLVVGVGTDHLTDPAPGLSAIEDAYVEQLHAAEDAGAGPVLMASRELARVATGPDDYRRVYRRVLRAAGGPVVLHWLGTAFDPALEGYFGPDLPTATCTLLDVVAEHADRVAGVKMSLLDADAEVAVRDRLPEGVRMFTGDDFHYVGLIGGADVAGTDAPVAPGSRGHSDALLGAFAAVGPLASAAVQALDAGDPARYLRLLAPTEALSRHVFAAPTYHYKAGVAFLAWLNGHQPAYRMVGGLHAARSVPHLSEIVRLANACGALERPELAAERWHALLRLDGVAVDRRVAR